MKLSYKLFMYLCFLICYITTSDCKAQSVANQFNFNGSHYKLEIEPIGYGRQLNVRLIKNVVIGSTPVPPIESSLPLPRYFTKEDFSNTAVFLLQQYEGKDKVTADKTAVDKIIENAYNQIVQDLNNPKLGLASAVDNLDGLDEKSVAGVVTLENVLVPLKEKMIKPADDKSKPADTESKLTDKESKPAYINSNDKLRVERVSVEFSNTLINKITIEGFIGDKRIVLSPEKYAMSVNMVNSNAETVPFGFGGKNYILDYGDVIKIYPNPETGILKKNISDSQILLSPSKKLSPVNSRGFSDYISAIIFSDLVGVEEESPNGLLQTEIKAFLPLTSNSPHLKTRLRLFSLIEPHINISKIGGKNYFLETGIINGSEDAMYINQFNLLRYNNLNFGLKLRMLWFVMPSLSSELALNASMNGYRTGLKQRYVDANTGNDEFREFNVFSYAPEISGSFILKPDNWIGISFTEGISKIVLLDSDVSSSFGNINRFKENEYDGTTSNRLFNERFFHFTDVTAFVLPSQTKKGGIFVRTRFFKNFSTTNNFYQFQIGYSTDVRNFVNTKK